MTVAVHILEFVCLIGRHREEGRKVGIPSHHLLLITFSTEQAEFQSESCIDSKPS